MEREDVQFIDTRNDSAFSGYMENKVSGHLKNAIQICPGWIAEVKEDKLKKFILDKGVNPEKEAVLYGSSIERMEPLKEKLKELFPKMEVNYFIEIEKMYKLSPEFFTQFPGYKYFVSPEWVNELIHGGRPDTYDNDKYLILDGYSSCFSDKDTYEESFFKGHIPGAKLIDMNELEGGPSLNIYEFTTIKERLESYGIDKDTTVITYSRRVNPPYRLALILLWAGVEDVRILNGGFDVWKNNGFPLVSGSNFYSPVDEFGRDQPKYPEIIVSEGTDIQEIKNEKEVTIVSVRSWNEHIGLVNGGYDSVAELDGVIELGEPEGTIWGFGGSDMSKMEDYFDPDGSLRNPLEIKSLWKGQGITEDNQFITFHCGTGWRACVPLFISLLLGWDNTHLYDGSWLNWQQSGLPVSIVENIERPDSKNDF